VLLNPAFEPVYYELTEALIGLNKPQDALGTLDKVREKFAPNFFSEYLAAMAYGRMKEYTNSLKYFESAEVMARAVDTNLLTHFFYFQLGSTYERIQKYEEAEKYFRKCLALSPDFGPGLNYLGYMWAEQGVNLSEARQLIEKAVKLEPKNAAYLDSLGWVLYKLEKPADALPYMLQALKNSEEPDSTLYDHLGDIYASLHERDKAREAWRKAIKIEPNDKIAKKLQAMATSQSAPP
jgi:tetratricopeptide (TPR) repeat protein